VIRGHRARESQSSEFDIRSFSRVTIRVEAYPRRRLADWQLWGMRLPQRWET